MSDDERKIVSIGSRLSKYIGSKATREKKLQAAAMQAEFTLHDTLIILCYLGRDPDPEISSQARKNLIPAARNWYARPDRPELPEPIHEIVMKVIEKVGVGDRQQDFMAELGAVTGNIGLLGLGEIIQAIDHNNRSVRITLERQGDTAEVFTENGKVVGAIAGQEDGLKALYQVFGWLDATFNYAHSGPGTFENRIKVNTLTLVMDALEHAPEDDPFELDSSRGWQVAGHLKVMNIFEIAEIFEMNSKQAVCRLGRPDAEGVLYFKNGRISNAALADMTGMKAACHLLAWPNASFAITRGGEEIPEVIHVGMQNLIIEAMRLLDEGVTVTEQIASELALIDELFEGRDLVTLPVLDKVRVVFGQDARAREALEADSNPVVRKAVRVKISKTVHKYLSPLTDHEIKLKAAQGKVPLSTTEKLVLLTYLSHDESQEIKDQARNTLESLDFPTYRKGLGADLHPSVMDYLVREMIRDEALIKVALGCENILEETVLHILENRQAPEVLKAVLDNKKLLERSPAVASKLADLAAGDPGLIRHVDSVEEAMLQGQTSVKVEGPLHFFGLAGLIRAAKQGARSGTIVLETAGKSGRVFFRKGKVVGALAGDLQGIAAVEDMIGWKESRFRYTLRTYHHVENLDSVAAEDLLNTTAAGPASDVAALGTMRVVSGSLDAMDIYEALCALEGVAVPMLITGVFEEGSGEIYRDRGRVLHAVVEGKEGPLQAMAALISWTGKRFVIRPAPVDFPTTVDRPVQDFFADAIKLIPDEVGQVTKPGALPEWELSESEYESLYHRIMEMGVADKMKLAIMGSKEARDILVRDANKMVAVAVVKSPKIQESEIEAISKSRSVAEDVLRQIAASNDWMRSYAIKLNLASNPKTPIPIAVKILSHLRGLDLRKLAKSKNVSAAIANQARRLAETKGDSY